MLKQLVWVDFTQQEEFDSFLINRNQGQINLSTLRFLNYLKLIQMGITEYVQ